MTKKTYKKLQDKLCYLTTTKALEMKKILKEAKSGGGGMHDNAAYENALMRERILAQQIKELNENLQNVTFIDNLLIDAASVGIGTWVKVSISDSSGKNKTREYSILGSNESDPNKDIISYLSPIGKSLIGGYVGEEVEVVIADKCSVFKILEIKKAML